MNKIFVVDKSDFVLDKKYFVQADGQGIRQNYFVLDKSDFVWADGQGICLIIVWALKNKTCYEIGHL